MWCHPHTFKYPSEIPKMAASQQRITAKQQIAGILLIGGNIAALCSGIGEGIACSVRCHSTRTFFRIPGYYSNPERQAVDQLPV
jgi:hypothetical protein